MRASLQNLNQRRAEKSFGAEVLCGEKAGDIFDLFYSSETYLELVKKA